MSDLDVRTGRPPGDHGRAAQAIEFALYDPAHVFNHDLYDKIEFLQDWFEGAAADDWPEFYKWLGEQPE